jgi:Ran-binding protein 3
MAYASPKSPFASVLGGNIFSESKKQSFFGATSPSPSETSLLPPFSEATSSTSKAKDGSPKIPFVGTAAKRSGFEAFSGSASPFASVARSKSPLSTMSGPWNPNKSPTRRANSINTIAFSPHSLGKAKLLSVPASKRPRALSPDDDPSEDATVPPGDGDPQDDLDEEYGENREATFGERLRSTGDDLEEGRSDEEQARPVLVEQESKYFRIFSVFF